MKIINYAASAIALAIASSAIVSGSPALAGETKFGAVPVAPNPAVAGRGRILIPTSSLERPEDIGRRVHTNHLIFATSGETEPAISPDTTFHETPASIACVYGFVAVKQGCNPAVVTAVSKGGGKMIAIVDAYHNPSGVSDLKAFSSKYGIATPNIEVAYCSASACGVSSPPPVDTGWALESALDIEAAHAIAPQAKILLVEA